MPCRNETSHAVRCYLDQRPRARLGAPQLHDCLIADKPDAGALLVGFSFESGFGKLGRDAVGIRLCIERPREQADDDQEEQKDCCSVEFHDVPLFCFAQS